MLNLVLASQSPRRRRILEKAGYTFQRLPLEVSEILDENLNFTDQIQKVSQTKVEVAIKKAKLLNLKDVLVLTADTAVGFQGKTLGKPKNFREASETLRLLSGERHEVCTAFHLWNSITGETVGSFDTTSILFKKLNNDQIQSYVATQSPMDKAGSYGLQDVKEQFVAEIIGCELNVIGLPLPRIEEILERKKWILH